MWFPFIVALQLSLFEKWLMNDLRRKPITGYWHLSANVIRRHWWSRTCSLSFLKTNFNIFYEFWLFYCKDISLQVSKHLPASSWIPIVVYDLSRSETVILITITHTSLACLPACLTWENKELTCPKNAKCNRY